MYEILRLGMLNCQGIEGKFETPEFCKLISSGDIFGVCETWLNNDKKAISIPGFNFYPFNRTKENHTTRGGLGVFIRHECKKHVKVMYDISTENILWCKVLKSFLNFDEDLYIGIVYIPPEHINLRIMSKKRDSLLLNQKSYGMKIHNIYFSGI